jgi:Ca2+-transporting ATPase
MEIQEESPQASTAQQLSGAGGNGRPAPIWHSLPTREVLERLDVNPETGLADQEAARRLERYGPNELREQPRPGFLARLLNQFRSVVILLLIAASIISSVLGEWPEAIAIMAIVLLNAILGVVQEGRAERALDALKKMSAPEAHLLRDGHRVSVSASQVVQGDVVLLEAGNYVPADLRLLETVNLNIDEASLTGESVPVSKDAERELPSETVLGDRKTMAYKSTIVTYGRGSGVVVATGMASEIGRIAEMIQATPEEETPLQKRLDQLGRWLVYGALVICGLVFGLAWWRGQEPLDAFMTAIALAIAAVPEGLPAIVTINLALGMREMIKRNALVRRLPAVETLGSASAICSDKTGTLTQSEMTAVRLYVAGTRLDVSGEGYRLDGRFHLDERHVDPTDIPEAYLLLVGAMLASDARIEEGPAEDGGGVRVVGDPTEIALVVAAAKANLTRPKMESLYPRVDEIPFDSIRKRMSTLHNDPDGSGFILFVKGAPDIVLEQCDTIYERDKEVQLTPDRREHLLNINRDLGREALRVLAVAYRRFRKRPRPLDADEHERNLTFIGLVAMIDPARPEVKPAIEKARQAGIKTVMVTGDYPDTARAIAQQIGLLSEGGRVVTGAELEEMDDAQLVEIIKQVDVFARVSPSHKVRIVDAFQKHDYVVAMTGDGVNDAPALKRASIGVAMGITGTDVSKETADMVLTDDNYVSIVSAVEQGRIIYSNIRKFVYFLLSCNLAEIAVIFIATLLGYPSPLSAIQLLWLNLLTDGAPALALGVEKGDPDIMQRPPRPPAEPIIDRVMRIGMTVQTIAITGVTLAAYFIGMNWGGTAEARSAAFVTLSFSELLRAYTTRSEYFSIFRIGPFGNKFMQYAVLTSVALLLVVIYVPFLQPIFDTIPLDLRDWAAIIPLILIPSVAAEITKAAMRAASLRRGAEAA